MNFLTLMLLACLSLFAEGAMSETVKLSGQLVYSAGSNDISLIELRSLKYYSLGLFSTDSINHLTKLSDRVILFEDCTGIRKPNCLLREFDIDAKATYRHISRKARPSYFMIWTRDQDKSGCM